MSNKHLQEVRKRNLRAIAERVGGQAELAKILKRQPSQLSQMIGRRRNDTTTGGSRYISDRFCREVEDTFNYHTGYLDRDHNEANEILPIVMLSSLNKNVTFDDWRGPSLSLSEGMKFVLPSAYCNVVIVSRENGLPPQAPNHALLFAETVESFTGEGIYAVKVGGINAIRAISMTAEKDTFMVKGPDTITAPFSTKKITFLAKIKAANQRITL